MKVKDLIRRLKTYDPEAEVVKFADMEGYDSCHSVYRTKLVGSKRQGKTPGNGTGEYLAAEVISKRSRAKRTPAVVIV